MVEVNAKVVVLEENISNSPNDASVHTKLKKYNVVVIVNNVGFVRRNELSIFY